MPNRKASTKDCIKGLLSFMRPYRTKAIIALVMIVITQGAFALNPMVEGMITSQLTEDAMDILNKIPGAHVHFDVIFKIMMILMGLYLLPMPFRERCTI